MGFTGTTRYFIVISLILFRTETEKSTKNISSFKPKITDGSLYKLLHQQN